MVECEHEEEEQSSALNLVTKYLHGSELAG